MKDNMKNKIILITGGTGSLGVELTHQLHENNKIIVYSRNEERQYLMKQQFKNHPNISYVIGDVRDTDTLTFALNKCNYAIHTAAMKDVLMCEVQPTQTYLNNIEGSRSFIKACLNAKAEKAVAISTDKAASPSNVYGCTKYIMEKLFEEAGQQSTSTVFCNARFGNMIDSTGSLVSVWKNNPKMDVKLTHPEVSRFFFTKKEAAQTVIEALLRAKNGETFIKQMKAARIKDILRMIQQKNDFEIIGLFPGEKLHEDLLSYTELKNCFFENGFYVIKPNQQSNETFKTHSSLNAEYFTDDELKKLIWE